MRERVITVKGTGKVSASPDWIVINISLETRKYDYQQTIDQAAMQLFQLRECLKEYKFDKKDIKTTDFRVDTSHKSITDKDGNYKSIFNGYKCSQSLYIEFEFDSKRLGDILKTLSFCKSKPEFRLSYEVKDKTKLTEELLKSGVKDATNKASILAKASNVKLGEILSIDYNWSEIRFIRDSFELQSIDCMSAAASLDIEPNEIQASDTVSIVWKIK